MDEPGSTEVGHEMTDEPGLTTGIGHEMMDERGSTGMGHEMMDERRSTGIGHDLLEADAEEEVERLTGSYSDSESWSRSGSDAEIDEHLQEERQSVPVPPVPEVTLEVKFTPSGLGFITDQEGEKVPFPEIIKYLEEAAFTDEDLKKLEEQNQEKDAVLMSMIRKERRDEERNTSLKSAESIMQLYEMALRYIPKVNIRPKKGDQMTLFQHGSENANKGTSYPQKAQQKQGLEFTYLLDVRDFGMGRVDSFATVPSTIERKFSNATVRGSLISTHLSDMPSMFSQALIEEPSTDVLLASQQQFDITPSSASKFREQWVTDFVKGHTPKNTFTISIINLITRKTVEMRVCKEYTLNQICHLYMQYDDHPEYYVWRDIFGRVLNPQKSMVENGMMTSDEKMEFQGYQKLPVILLYFRDGFENDPPVPLNPIHAMRQKEPGPCRNY